MPRNHMHTHVLGAACTSFVASATLGQCAYDVLVIEQHPTWDTFSVVALSNDSTVAGTYVLPSGPAHHVFKWHPSTGHVALPKPPGATEADAAAISSNGIVAGQCKIAGLGGGNPSLMQLVVWDGLVPYSPPPTDPPNGFQVRCVASSGLVGGTYGAGPLSGTAFLFLNGRFLAIPRALDQQIQCQVFGITDNNYYSGHWVESDLITKKAFIASLEGQVFEIPTPKGYVNPSIRELTSQLHGALWTQVPASPEFPFGLKRTFPWDGSMAIDIGVAPEMDWTSPAGMNDVDQIVGGSGNAELTQAVPFIWQKGVMTDLRQLVVLPPNHVLSSVVDINDGGVILAAGKKLPAEKVGYILTPLTIDEDVDLDCTINVDDLLYVIENWGEVGPSTIARADVDRSGVVDGYDLALVLGAWSPSRR